MPSQQLARVIDHLRGVARKLQSASSPGSGRELMRIYNQIDPSTHEVVAGVRHFDLAGVQCEWLVAAGADPDRRLLYIHGGGWTSGDLESHRPLSARISKAAGVAVLAVHYRLAPEHPFPAGLDDCVHAYRWLRANGPNGPAPARSIFVAGDSAGGNLTLATLLACKERGLPLPTGAIPISAATDFAAAGESFRTRAGVDPIIAGDPQGIRAIGAVYTQGRAEPLSPLCSPLHGDLRGLPPLLVQVGDAEVLLDDSTRFAAKAKAAGVDVTLEVWPDMPHVWHLFAPFLPEASEAIEHIGQFVRKHG
uniref:Esterase n=1 Tax=uncultured microorganism TaxID=358574 RepID=A0A8E8PFX1_9ZZZZ|nr:esterase [uncultured microorganism]